MLPLIFVWINYEKKEGDEENQHSNVPFGVSCRMSIPPLKSLGNVFVKSPTKCFRTSTCNYGGFCQSSPETSLLRAPVARRSLFSRELIGLQLPHFSPAKNYKCQRINYPWFRLETFQDINQRSEFATGVEFLFSLRFLFCCAYLKSIKYLPKDGNEKCSKFEKWMFNKTNNLDYIKIRFAAHFFTSLFCLRT